MKHQPRIVVIGSANIDLVTYTDQFPRPGETIFGREFSLGFGGKGANQAVAAARSSIPRMDASSTAPESNPGGPLVGSAGFDDLSE